MSFCLPPSLLPLSSLPLSLRHHQPLLHLQPALPSGLWHRPELLLWREEPLLHPTPWSWPAKLRVQCLLPRKGDYDKAPGALTTKVAETGLQLHQALFFSCASSLALVPTISRSADYLSLDKFGNNMDIQETVFIDLWYPENWIPHELDHQLYRSDIYVYHRINNNNNNNIHVYLNYYIIITIS